MSDMEKKMKTIKIECQGADVVEFEELKSFQGNLKKIKRENLDKLKKRITKSFDVPFFVWKKPDGSKNILDGHQRQKAIIELKKEGYEIPPLPVIYVLAENEKQAKEKLLGITSQYGEFDLSELEDWLKDFDSDIVESLRFTENEISFDKEINLEDFNAKTAKKEKELLSLTVVFPDKKYKTLFFMKLSAKYGNDISVDDKFKKLIEDL